jgi:hypothetical protein
MCDNPPSRFAFFANLRAVVWANTHITIRHFEGLGKSGHKSLSIRVAVERLQGELLRCSRSSRKVVEVFTWTLVVTSADVNNHALLEFTHRR